MLQNYDGEDTPHSMDFMSTEEEKEIAMLPEFLQETENNHSDLLHGIQPLSWTPNKNSNPDNGETVSVYNTMDDGVQTPNVANNETFTNECEELSTSNTVENNANSIQGRRVVDVLYMFSEISRMCKHDSLFNCTFSDMNLLKEERKGMLSIFHFECAMCGKKDTIHSENTGNPKMDVNDAWVSGMIMSGQGYSQMRTITATLDMPCMSKETFQSRQNKLYSAIHDVAWQKMEAAGKEEAELAIKAGDVGDDGIPTIAVVTDGAWCKRSFGSNYNALSGVVSKIRDVSICEIICSQFVVGFFYYRLAL